MFKFCLWVLVCVSVVNADYDFKDSDFNQILFEDLRTDFDDFFEQPLRFRREADNNVMKNGCHHERGKKDRDIHCCTGEKVDLKQIELLKEVKKQCWIEIQGTNETDVSFDPFDCAQMQIIKEQMKCTGECISKKFNLLDEEGQLKRETLLAHLRLKIGDVKWKAEVLEGFVDKCLAELKPIKESIYNETDDKNTVSKKCNARPLQFTHCIWKEFVQGCPRELQVDSGKCKKMRERLARGDTSFLHKAFLHHLHSRNEDKKESI